eukprot:CAMPEP_0116876422 /NCGR_PEP_ID=MMETSP0463-20121206/8364_1 /TAXON_ID=181622 /ORGANISM="Strombidinopsis sp, Strain SopsisLIS2011" /LENGTH=129 /DNA_ID=CAMNT_0004523011 /DNA_START=938 /DNA_END=1327 /DNA_ORIENTATION=+
MRLNKTKENANQEENTAVTTVEVVEAVADLVRMKMDSSLSKERTRSQETIVVAEAVVVAVEVAEEVINKTVATVRKVITVLKKLKMFRRNKRRKRNLLLPRNRNQNSQLLKSQQHLLKNPLSNQPAGTF